MKNSQTIQTARKRHPLVRKFYLVLVLLIIVGASGFIMVTQKPGRYEPAAERESDAVSTFLTHDIAQTWYNNVEAGTPFELVVEQDKLNDIIANEPRLGFTWPIDLDGARISTPAAAFTDGEVLLMAPIEFGKVRLVITVCSKPDVGPDGLLTLNIQSVKAGLLNITSLAHKFAAGMIKKQLESVESTPENAWLNDIADAMLDNKPIEPVWPSHDGHIVRLTGTAVSDGKMTLSFEPLDKQSAAQFTAGHR